MSAERGVNVSEHAERPVPIPADVARELLAACRAVAGVFQDHEDMPQYARKCIAAIERAEGKS